MHSPASPASLSVWPLLIALFTMRSAPKLSPAFISRTQAHVKCPGGEQDGEIEVVEVEVRQQEGDGLEPPIAPGNEWAKRVATEYICKFGAKRAATCRESENVSTLRPRSGAKAVGAAWDGGWICSCRATSA